jgi:AbrB family looped-hinge helix DNA binding protein
MTITKIGRRGQLTLPKEIRQKLQLREGDHVAFYFDGDQVIMQPLTQTLLDLRGSVPVDAPQDFDAIRRQAVAARARRAAGDGG